MSRRSNGPKLELKLNLSPPRNRDQQVQSPNGSVSSWEISTESSCVSSEPEDTTMHYTSSPDTTNSMLLLGCPRCFMYVMLSDVNPKCPKCKSTVLLDFLNEDNPKKTSN
ncbi:hypothetical protein ACOSQ2_016292 [Xanthoceras sorbifolium]|uniref:GIR1-like zinc ribbon domain-containing protein n=1 Tax=Xanthoceras sorbifolium TaxID=99658 RepID=A0ABQ8HJN2_9ROSI|nr:hypothetical protein JRO89_XS10G0206300 [Xanthoceras sorbifolium]